MEENDVTATIPVDVYTTSSQLSDPPRAEEQQAPKKRRRLNIGLREIIFLLLITGVVVGSGSSSSSIFGHYKKWIWHFVEFGWIAYIVVNLVRDITSGTLKQYWHYYRKITPVILLQSTGMIFVVLTVAVVLYKTMPFLDRSWIYVLQPKYHVVKVHQLNATGHATTVYRKVATKSQATNVITLPFKYGFVGLVFGIGLLMVLPLFAFEEEMMFRNGTRDWKHGRRRSLAFGLMHCVVGVPIFVGLALGVGGMWFTYQYFKGGVERSTTYHLAYNATIFVTFMCYLTFTLFHH